LPAKRRRKRNSWKSPKRKPSESAGEGLTVEVSTYSGHFLFFILPHPPIFSSSIFRKDEDPENKIEFKTRLGE
jgi:hypothetical protein